MPRDITLKRFRRSEDTSCACSAAVSSRPLSTCTTPLTNCGTLGCSWLSLHAHLALPCKCSKRVTPVQTLSLDNGEYVRPCT
jgi:hypothetical protein